jgi:tRNA G10  N-methylase Trm11
MTVLKSVYTDQSDILRAIKALHCPDGFMCDITYGNGVFWKDLDEPQHKFDIDPQRADVVKASSDALPLDDKSMQSVVFDPPFLTYVREGRGGNGKMIMAKRFSGYWRYDELEAHYRATLRETRRVLASKGIMVFKCQDIVHNHRLHCTHINVVNWAAEFNFRLKDLFVLTANHRLPSPNRVGTQKHARIYHSYFLVLQ